MQKNRIIFLLLACFIPYGLYAKGPIEVTIYSDESYPPYSYKENGKAAGIYTEILQKIFSNMDGYNIRIEPVPWKYGLHLLKTGKGFALYPPYWHLIKRPYIRPYSLPILDEEVVVFCTEDVMKTPRSRFPEDYYHLTFGNNSGFQLGGKKFWRAIKKGKIKVIERHTITENLEMMAKRQVDCYLNDRLSILWEWQKMKKNGRYVSEQHTRFVEAVTVSKEAGYLGFTYRDKGKFKYKIDFVTRFNREFVKMKRSGEVKAIVQNFLNKPSTF